MIKDYTTQITKNDLYLLKEESIFLVHTHEDTVYFNLDFWYHGWVEKLPKNFHTVAKILEGLWVIWELRLSNELEDWYFAIDEYNFEKINLLDEILFHPENRENSKLLDEITQSYAQKWYRVQTLLEELDIIDPLVIFNDLEILIHAIYIKYPDIFTKFRQYIHPWENEKMITSIKVRWNFIESIPEKKIILKLTPTEAKIIDIIKKMTKNWWISKRNLITNTQQTDLAFEKSLQTLNKKINTAGIWNLLNIRFIRWENVYVIDIK